jgi:hypothetical protein
MRLTAGLASARGLVGEARELRAALEEAPPRSAVTVVISGMLAEQLARELARGAEPGVVRLADGRMLTEGDLAIHVFAGEPSDDDRAYLRAAERQGVSVVLVQLWPQDDWTAPFVLSPFVVECKPGAGFPMGEIAARILDAVGTESALAERLPVLREELERRAVRQAVVKAGLLGALGGRSRAARPLITLEQARLVARLRLLPEEPASTGAALAGSIAALEAWGHAFRRLARRAGRVAPTRVTNAAVAAGGTLALAAIAKALRARLNPSD